MAPPPSLKRLSAENFEEAEDWFKENFLVSLNGFLGDVVNALSGALNVADNIAAEEREVRVTTLASVVADTAPFPILLTPQKMKTPRNFVVTDVQPDGAGIALPAAAVQAFCRMTAAGQVEVRYFTGLAASTTYTIRVRWS